jgi:hypothetical protein
LEILRTDNYQLSAKATVQSAVRCGRWCTIAWRSRHQIIIAAGMRIFACLALSTGGIANLRADDTPKTSCTSISARMLQIRTDDLSSLSQRQQTNISYYLAEEARENKKNSRRLNIFNDATFRNQQLNFSLIFPDGRCERGCVGTAVLPSSDKIRLQKFFYRNNLVVQPNPQSAAVNNQQHRSVSLVLLDEKEQSFLAFYDVFRRPPTDRNGKLLDADFVGSEFLATAAKRAPSKYENYLACLQNVFNVDDVMPGSGAR